MELSVERVDVWAATIEDKPGGLAQVLSALRDAAVDLQFVVARRTPEAPDKGVVFVAPLQGEREIRAATQVGFSITTSLYSVRVMGLDRLGIIAQLAQTLAGRRRIEYLWKEQGGRCEVCGQPLRIAEEDCQIHHRTWRSRGGADTADNLELLHANCHRQIHVQERWTKAAASREGRL